jgi:uncharacterized protein
VRSRAIAPLLGLAALTLALAAPARAETPIPAPPTTWVTDRVAFLSAGTKAELDQKLGDWAARTGHQLLVYIDGTTGGVPIEDWAVKAFESWRIGRKGIDDGLGLFVFSEDRRVRVEVGYGLEDRVTDLIASRLISDEMAPRIRAGDRDGAVRAAVTRLMAVVGDEPAGAAAPAPLHVSGVKMVLGGILLLFFFGFMVTHPGLAFLMMMNIGGGRRGGFGGGGFGGGGFGGGGFSGGGGRSGGGGASGSW